MGKLKWGIITVILVAVAGLFFGIMKRNEEFSGKEFLFDTYCTVTVYGDDAEETAEKVFKRVEEIHNITNAFSKSSEVFKINTAKAGETVVVCDDMAEILTVAAKIEAASGRAFDTSIAPVVLLWDFGGEGKVPDDEKISRELEHTGEGKIIFDATSKTVVKTDDDAKLDLGGAAKGYAGDVAIRVIEESGASGAIVDFGGNILCVGENPKADNGKWRIGLQKPYAPTGEYDENNIVELTEGAVVTSGTYQRYFEKNGKQYHHIIDPETGYPAQRDYFSVTVVTDSSLLGDCLSTACFVLGREKGTELAKQFEAEVYFE